MEAIRRQLLAVGLSLATISIHAADNGAVAAATAPPRFVPAYFVDGPESLQRLIACPNAKPRESLVRVLCSVGISADGQVDSIKSGWTGCAAPDGGSDAYRAAAERALAQARFSPATIDGQRVAVQTSALILFLTRADGCRATALLNGGQQDPAVGIDYVEPQLVRAPLGHSWWSRLDAPTRRRFRQLPYLARWPGTLFLRMSVEVGLDGRASAGRIEGTPQVRFLDARNSVEALEQCLFIPGFFRGRPAVMRRYQTFYVRSSVPHDLGAVAGGD